MYIALLPVKLSNGKGLDRSPIRDLTRSRDGESGSAQSSDKERLTYTLRLRQNQ